MNHGGEVNLSPLLKRPYGKCNIHAQQIFFLAARMIMKLCVNIGVTRGNHMKITMSVSDKYSMLLTSAIPRFHIVT